MRTIDANTQEFRARDGAITAARDSELRVIEPGTNCWRIDRADRAAVLIDGAAYFAALESSLRKAKRSIVILGWDFDPRIRLRPHLAESESPQLGALLRSLVEERPDLQIHVLVWSLSLVCTPDQLTRRLVGENWAKHPRITVRFDGRHPPYAAHHQKVVCVDGAVAYSGGIDLTTGRWDTPGHHASDPARVDPCGKPCTPVHDVQIVVDGEAARSMAALVSARWSRATGARLPHAGAFGSDRWPDGVAPQFRDIGVAIARTQPAIQGKPEVREVEALTLDAIRAARQSIYIEAQYMTAARIGDEIERHLTARTGPEIVVVMSRAAPGRLERWAMSGNRDRLIRRLARADKYGRLRICYPTVARRNGPKPLHVHSKVVIVDDVLLRVGSSNLNNRSMGLDTECDLAIEARNAGERAAITSIRDTLLAEHLGVSPKIVRRASAGGRIARAVDLLNAPGRGLVPFKAMTDHGPSTPGILTPIIDPERPFLASLKARLQGTPMKARPSLAPAE